MKAYQQNIKLEKTMRFHLNKQLPDSKCMGVYGTYILWLWKHSTLFFFNAYIAFDRLWPVSESLSNQQKHGVYMPYARVSEISGHAYSSEKITRCWRYNLSTMWNITTWQWEIFSGCRHSFQHNKHNTTINFFTEFPFIQIYSGHFIRMARTYFEII